MIFKLFKLFENLENFEINDYVLLLSTILMTYVAYYYYTYFTRVNPLPGPFPFPFIGNLPQVYWLFNGDAQMFYNYCYKKYGDIHEIYATYSHFANVRSIVLCRRRYLNNFLSEKSKHWMRINNCKGPEELGIEGKGVVFNGNYKSWLLNRHFFSQAILSPKFTNEAIEWTNELFNELEGYWNELIFKEEIVKGSKNILNLSQWLNNYSTDLTIKLLTGEDSYLMAGYFYTLIDEKSDQLPVIVKDFAKLIQALHKHLTGFSIFYTISPFLRHYVPFFKNKADDILKNMQFINRELGAIIKRRRQEIEDTPLNEPLPHDMLTLMIIKNTFRDVNYIEAGEVARSMTDTEIRFSLLEGILSGTYKTANMLAFSIYYVLKYPDVKMKMLEEIDSIFQGDKMRPITKDDFYELNYCEAIVKEVARISPIMHSISRCIDKPDEIAGYQWPADTLFRVNVDAIHYNKDYWEEPDKFNPDRWMNENFEPKNNSYIMFGGGLRLCPGRKLAMIELICLMVLLFRKYEINLVDIDSPLKTTNTGFIVACGELLVEIKPRN